MGAEHSSEKASREDSSSRGSRSTKKGGEQARLPATPSSRQTTATPDTNPPVLLPSTTEGNAGRRSPRIGSARSLMPAQVVVPATRPSSRARPSAAESLQSRQMSLSGAVSNGFKYNAAQPRGSMPTAPQRAGTPGQAAPPAPPAGSKANYQTYLENMQKWHDAVNVSPLDIPMVAVTGGRDTYGNIVELDSAILNTSQDSDSDSKQKRKPDSLAAAAAAATADPKERGGILRSNDPPANGDDIVSIATIETPPGIDSGSSSSSSSGFDNNGGASNTRGNSAQPCSRAIRFRGIGGNNSHNCNSTGFSGDTVDDQLTPNTPQLTVAPLRSFDGNDLYDDFDLHSNSGGAGLHVGEDDEDVADRGSNVTGCSAGILGEVDIGGTPGMSDETSHNGLATFFNRPKECHNCQSSAVAYTCEQCTSFYLCEDCRFNESVLGAHDRAHRIVPLHETHCNTSRTFGGSSSLGTMECASSLFYDPCSICNKNIDDTEPVYRCETCDFIICASCHNTQTVEHPHELRRFQRKNRNGSVTEGTLFNKSRTNDGNKTINDYVVVRLLGQGSFAKVKLVQNIRTRKLYALKILRKARRSQGNLLTRGRARQSDDDLLREIAVMKFVNHPNIVKLAEVIDDVDGGKVYVIMEYCAKGPVHVLGNPVLPISDVHKHGLGILAGLLHMHSEFLYHRDVKPANCLVDDQNVVKIADFGTCNSRIRTTAVEGTPAFTCPEQIRGEEASGDVTDSWAYALTLYQMAYGVLPCNGMGPFQYRELLLSQDPIAVPPLAAVNDPAVAEAVHNDKLTDLLKRMLDKDTKHRMLLGAAAQHPFFALDDAAVKRLCRPSMSLNASKLGSRCTSGLLDNVPGGAVVTASAAPPGNSGSSLPPGNAGRRRSTPSNLNPTMLGAALAGNRGGSTAGTAPHASASASHASGSVTGFYARRRSLASNSGTDSNPSGGVSPISASKRNAHLYEKALQEVRRGKNLTEAFYGVKSLRRVRRKDMKNADNNVDHDDVSSVGRPGSSQVLVGEVGSPSAFDGTPSPNSRDGSGTGGPNPKKSSRSRAPPPQQQQQAGTAFFPASHSTSNRTGLSSSNNSLSIPGLFEGQRRLSQPSQSDAAFDMATIIDRLSQQRNDQSSSLDLVRLKMCTAPAEVNKVADITTNLRFSMNSLLSVSLVKFYQFTFLKDITITSNQLKRFPEEVLKAPRLLRLDLSHNKIVSIPPSVAKVKFLERLNLHSNSIRAVGVDPCTRLSVLAAPSLRHVRLSSNPIEALPENLESTQGIELVLDANPAVMKEWDSMVDRNMQLGRALPAVVIWDDYFPVRIPGCAYDVWVASGDLSLYRAHTLRACDTPYVVLLSGADPRFPAGGAMTSQQLTAFLNAKSARSTSANGKYTVLQPLPRALPPIISKEARAFAKDFFFVSDDVDSPGNYNDLLDFLIAALAQQRDAFAEKGVAIDENTDAVVPLGVTYNNKNNVSSSSLQKVTTSASRSPLAGGTSRSHGRVDEGCAADFYANDGPRPNSGKGIMLALTNSSAVKDAREFAVAALSDALCKMSNRDDDAQLKVIFDAVMEAMRSLYA